MMAPERFFAGPHWQRGKLPGRSSPTLRRDRSVFERRSLWTCCRGRHLIVARLTKAGRAQRLPSSSLVFEAALGHSGGDAAARDHRARPGARRWRACACPCAEELRHATRAGGACDARHARRRDALFGHAAGLRCRVLLVRGMPYRSRSARDFCRRTVDPRRSDRPRPRRARCAHPRPSADPLRHSVNRYRLDAAFG